MDFSILSYSGDFGLTGFELGALGNLSALGILLGKKGVCLPFRHDSPRVVWV